jgi:flagellar hook assembly protein FlgD
MFRTHTTVLNNTFAGGETILLRFRLFADSSVNSWGWAIDDIAITNTYVSGAGDVPAATSLAQNYPNPFNPATTISYSLAKDARVELKIFDARGALVRTLVDGSVAAGEQRVTWNGRDDNDRPMAAGVYLYRLRADGQELQKKMTLVK